MKFKGLFVTILLVLILGLGTVALGSQLQPNTPNANDIKIIASNTTLKVGDFGFITIQAKPNTQYTISTSYQKGNERITVLQRRLTDAQGQATFNWKVENGTAPGSNSAAITGGGASITISHTVTQ